MADVLVGTSGYSYRDWVGPVYPEGTRAAQYLELYARKFSFVELNFCFYRQPDPATMDAMAARVGPEFRFAAKAHRSLTHDRGTDVGAEASRFRAGLEPLRQRDVLAAVLVQFPYSFHYTPDTRRRLDEVLRHLSDLPLAVEFRNDEWQRESVSRELRARGIATVIVDTPRLPHLPRPEVTVTSGTAYIRFHGRNTATWWNGDAVSRYDYLYSDGELDEWVQRAEELLEKVKLLIVSFNNHYHGQAVRNAEQFLRRLDQR